MDLDPQLLAPLALQSICSFSNAQRGRGGSGGIMGGAWAWAAMQIAEASWLIAISLALFPTVSSGVSGTVQAASQSYGDRTAGLIGPPFKFYLPMTSWPYASVLMVNA